MITYDLIARPNAYGFGRDWTIVLKKGNITKTFWLGQDIKVVSRILGMRMSEAVEYYNKKANSKNFEVVSSYIAADILRVILKTKKLDQDKLDMIFKLNSWEMSV